MHCVCDGNVHSEHCVCNLLSVCGCMCTSAPHICESRLLSILLRAAPCPPSRAVHTNGLAVLARCVHLIARVALALKVALVIDTDLAAGVWVLALINVCGEEQRSQLAEGPASVWGGGEGLTAASLLVQEPVACWARALKANLEVGADVGAAAVVVQTLVQSWGGKRASEGPGAQAGVGPGRGGA